MGTRKVMVASIYWLTMMNLVYSLVRELKLKEFDNILADRSETETCMEMFLVVVEIRDEVTYQFLSYDQGTLEHRSLRVAAASTSLKQKFKVLISAPIGLQIPTRIVYGPDGTFAIVREFMIDGSLRMSYAAKISINCEDSEAPTLKRPRKDELELDEYGDVLKNKVKLDCGSCADVMIQGRSNIEKFAFLRDRLVSWVSKKQDALQYLTTVAVKYYCHVWMLGSNPLDAILA
ncbi:hypothetical protein Tco_0748996 [Tanacetum coccineum]|uniref:Uncharacterized protein n=1 Tax=Tanacetum coccineum TaxID=301880 RepID=A0ABQ4YXH3_9ASTR